MALTIALDSARGIFSEYSLSKIRISCGSEAIEITSLGSLGQL
jgi:hypothetical protein